MTKQYYAIQTKPRQEQIAAVHYGRQGIEVYLPQVQATRRHARRVEQIPRPLFPGYLFLRLSPEEKDWTAISSTIGAIGPVRFGDYFPVVPDWLIQRIKERENEKGIITLRALGDSVLKPGSCVRVDIGAAREVDGIFLEFKDDDRVVILLEILRRELEVVVPLARLKVA